MLTVADIHTLKLEAQAYWAGLHGRMAKDYIEIAEGPQVTLKINNEPQTTINPHTAAVKVRTAANHLIDGDMKIAVDRNARAEATRKKGEGISQALKAIFYYATEMVAHDPHDGCLSLAAGLGMGVWYVNADFGQLEMIEARKPIEGDYPGGADSPEFKNAMDFWDQEHNAAFPIILDFEDPRCIYPDPGTHGRRYVMKIERRKAGDVKRNWPGWEPPLVERDDTGRFYNHRKTDFEEVEWFELWSAPGGLSPDDPGIYYYEADGIPITRPMLPDDVEDADEPVGDQGELGEVSGTPLTQPWDPEMKIEGPWEHKRGFCPYVVWSAGYGMAKGKPEDVFKGIIRNAREGGLFRAKAEKRTQIHTISRNAAWSSLAVPEGYSENVDLAPGAINEMPVDQTGKVVLPQPFSAGLGPSPQIFTEANVLDSEIDSETIASIMSTAESSSGDPALKFARQIQEAAMALGPLRRNAERAYNEVCKRIAQLLSNPDLFGSDEEFSLTGIERGGDPYVIVINQKLFSGKHIFQTTIDPRFPTDQIGKTQSGLAQWTAGGIDQVTYLDQYAGIPNPERVMNKAKAGRVIDQMIAEGYFSEFAKAFAAGQVPKDMTATQFAAMQQMAQQMAQQMFQQMQQQAGAAAGGSAGAAGAPAANGNGGQMQNRLHTPLAEGAAGKGEIRDVSPVGTSAGAQPSTAQLANIIAGLTRPGGPTVEPGISSALSRQLPGTGAEPRAAL